MRRQEKTNICRLLHNWLHPSTKKPGQKRCKNLSIYMACWTANNRQALNVIFWYKTHVNDKSNRRQKKPLSWPTICFVNPTPISVPIVQRYVKPISQLRFDYDTTIPWRIRLWQKWSKLWYAFDSTAIRLQRKIDVHFCLRWIGTRHARYAVVGL